MINKLCCLLLLALASNTALAVSILSLKHSPNPTAEPCLDYVGLHRNNDDVAVSECLMSSSWYFERIGGYLSNKVIIHDSSTAKCLDDLHGSNYVGVWSCNGNSNQQWTIKGSEIVSGEGNCLDLGANGKIYAWTCHGGANQQWKIVD
ncbi:ricin-type beta-trefoil lectin domain protein [Thalassotalea piscium]